MKSRNILLSIKLFVIGLMLAATSLIFVPNRARAAEITPDPSSYKYGSTSEYSSFEAVQPEPGSSTTQLVNTGSRTDSSKILIALASVAIFSFVILTWKTSSRLRNNYKLRR